MKVELLSPAGNMDSLKAAIANGANAVYMGGNKFNARLFAENFINIEEQIEYAALRNVHAYITLNTLIKDNEFDEACKYAEYLQNVGASAIIVQDIGLAEFLSKNLSIPIHGSTQMSIHNSYGAKFLQDMGFDRVVLAREISINNIKNIRKNAENIDIEAFVHGALCASFSGQCCMSAFMGNRSGNRGMCAGSCRTKYTFKDNESYLFSAKDLCTINNVEELINAGVTSFKIEGRVKRPEYVAIVTKAYRNVIDSILSNTEIDYEKINTELLKIYNRGGFTKGYYFFENESENDIFGNERPNHFGEYIGEVVEVKKNKVFAKIEKQLNVYDGISFRNENKDIGMQISDLYEEGKRVDFGTGNISFSCVIDAKPFDKIFRTTDFLQITEAQKTYEDDTFVVECDAKVYCKEKLLIEISCNLGKITFISDTKPEAAKNAPISRDDILKCINKTKNTFIEFKNMEIEMDENLWMPLKAINELRRKGIEALTKEIIKNFAEKRKNKYEIIESDSIELSNIKNIAIVGNISEFYTKKYDCVLYFPKEYNAFEINKCIEQKLIDGIVLPHITFDEDMEKLEEIASKLLPCIVVCNNISQIIFLQKFSHIKVFAGFGLNGFNIKSTRFLQSIGCNFVFLSLELNSSEISNISRNTNNIACAKEGAFVVMNFIKAFDTHGIIKNKKDDNFKMIENKLYNKSYCLIRKINFSNNDCKGYIHSFLDEKNELTSSRKFLGVE